MTILTAPGLAILTPCEACKRAPAVRASAPALLAGAARTVASARAALPRTGVTAMVAQK